jgi:hypothetical protein
MKIKCPSCNGIGDYAPIPGDTPQHLCRFCNGNMTVGVWDMFIWTWIAINIKANQFFNKLIDGVFKTFR